MTRVADWLAGLGLGQYAQGFDQARIGMQNLAQLGEQDFRDLGVSIGHRRKLIAAIRDLESAGEPAKSQPEQAAQQFNEEAERRQITVLFCDVVGSTALAARIDPEEMRDILHVFQAKCGEIAKSYDGFLARFMGDAVLVYFGYPRAHGDDAERAVRAGLDLAAAIPELKFPVDASLAVRVGIATGPVIVGDLIGEGIASERAVVGETPNIAARLQGLAQPGAVTIAASTRLLIGETFQLQDLGLHYLKGYPEPVCVWQVNGLSSAGTRFEAMRINRHAQVVGRDDDMRTLLACKRMAWSGAGQAVLISGEPGIGKSRLANRLAEDLAPEQHIRLLYQCSPYHSSSAFYPVIQHLRAAAGLLPGDSDAQSIEKLEKLLALPAEKAAETLPVFAELLSLRYEDRRPGPSLSASQKRRLTLEALVCQIERLAAQKPVFLLFEDIHWADATSIELFNLTWERMRDRCALLVATTRPGLEQTWPGSDGMSTIELKRLAATDIRRIVANIAGDNTFPDEAVEQIVDRSGGVPLFAEELTRAVLGQLEGNPQHRAAATADGQSLAIPSTLQDSLMAQLDALGVARQVAQIGSAIGRSFSYKMIAALTNEAPALLQASVSKMLEAGVIYQAGTPQDPEYIFKHALVQDAAYGSLLRRRRRELHSRIAETIEARFPTLIETEPEVIAQHCERAGDTQKAVNYRLKAGQRALRRSSLKEAKANIEAALAQVALLPVSTERSLAELSCQTVLAHALVGSDGYGAPETMAAWQRARQLAEEAGTAEQQFAINYGLWVGLYAQAEVAQTQSLAEESLLKAIAANDRTQLCVAQRMAGIAHFTVAAFEESERHCSAAIASYDMKLHAPLVNALVHDLLVAPLCFRALSRAALGATHTARADAQAALAHAQALGHAPSLGYALWHGRLLVGYILGDGDTLGTAAEELLAHALTHGLSMWEFGARVVIAWEAARRTGDASNTETMLLNIDIGNRKKARITDSLFFGLLGDAQAATGNAAAGLVSVRKGIALANATGVHAWLAELHRLEASVLLAMASPDLEAAEAALHAAIASSRKQSAHAWELRAALDLSDLLAGQGRPEEARVTVAQAYRAMAPNGDSPAMRKAASLLHQVSYEPEHSA